MKDFRKTLVMILSATMMITLLPGVPARANDAGDTFPTDERTYDSVFNGKTDQYTGKTVILHSNDVHGAIAGYAKIAELEDDFEEAGAEVITMDAGDYSQGAREVNSSKGADAITLMSAAGYEYSTLGNHEFDYGWPQLKSNLSVKKSFDVLCANILEGGKTIYDAHDVYTTKSGLKVGIFGLDTPELKSAYAANVKGLTIVGNTSATSGELYDCAKGEVSALKNEGADVIVALTHLGMERYLEANGNRSVDVYKNVPGIDIMLDGHSHDVMTSGPNKEMVQSTQRGFKYIGVVVIDDATKKISDHYVLPTEGLDEDETVKAEVDKIVARVDKEFEGAVGTNKVEFASTKNENRSAETNTGDLVTDALMWEALQYKESFKVSQDKVVALFNASSLPQDHPLPRGKVTKGDIRNSLYSYDNYVQYVYVKGSQLLEALEAATKKLPEPAGQYPQTKGIKFTLDTTKTFVGETSYEGTDDVKPDSINRITIESINGNAFDVNETYLVVSSDFCATGSAAYGAFKGSEVVDTGVLIYDAIGDYISDGLGGVISAKRYATPRGDVTIIPTPETYKETYEYDALDGASVGKLTKGKAKITVTVKKTAEEINGTEISYSTSKKFTKKTTKTVKLSAKKTKTTVKKLKSGKKYYVRVRTYAKVAGKTVYSKWSKVKSIKVK